MHTQIELTSSKMWVKIILNYNKIKWINTHALLAVSFWANMPVQIVLRAYHCSFGMVKINQFYGSLWKQSIWTLSFPLPPTHTRTHTHTHTHTHTLREQTWHKLSCNRLQLFTLHGFNTPWKENLQYNTTKMLMYLVLDNYIWYTSIF